MITEKISEYRHSDFQAAIAGVVLSHICDFKIVISPTGSGKTWIQGIVAKYYCSLGKKLLSSNQMNHYVLKAVKNF